MKTYRPHSFPPVRSYFCMAFFMLFWSIAPISAKTRTQHQDSVISGFLDATPEVLGDYFNLAEMYLEKLPEKSLQLSIEAIGKARKTGGISLAKAYKSAGNASYKLDQFDNSNLYYDSAMTIYAAIPDSFEMALIYKNLGELYTNFSLYVKALEYYDNALDFYSALNDKKGMAETYVGIGELNLGLNDYKQAHYNLNKAYELIRQLNKADETIAIQDKLGILRLKEGKYTEARSFFRKNLFLPVKSADLKSSENALLQIGRSFILEKVTDSAFYYLNQALHSGQESGNSLAAVWFALGETHLLNHGLRQALNAFLRAKEELELYPDQELKINVYKKLYETWRDVGNETEAFSALQHYHLLSDSVKRSAESKTAANTSTRFFVAKKLNELTQLKQEKVIKDTIITKEKKSNRFNLLLLFLSIAIVFMLIVLIAYILRINKKYRNTNNLLQQQFLELEQAKDKLGSINQSMVEQEEKLNMLINSIPDIICFKDGMGRWLIANQSMLRQFRIEFVDYKCKTDLELIADTPSCEYPLRVCVVSDEEAWLKREPIRNDETIYDPYDVPRVYDMIKIPLFFSDGTRKGLLVIGRDVTERKEAETELETTLQKAEESDRLKSAFVANMSHEIRTPLNAIIGFSELLESGTHDAQKTKEFVRHIRTNGSALLNLINEILEISHIESGSIQLNSENFDIQQLFSELHASFTQLAQQKGKARLSIKKIVPNDSPLFVFSDKNRIRQILINLFDNALKFTGEGSISYGFDLLKKDEKQQTLRIFVSDTGIGIPQSKKHLLFKRFTKIHESMGMVYPGAGLGLSIVQQIVMLFDGHINVESVAGSGTTVEILLPYTAQQHPAESFATHTSRDLEHLVGKKVLVVEDVDSNYELLEIILKSLGMKLLRAVEGQQAIDICNETDDIDIVLMDIQLKGMDGLEATKAIKKVKPNIPIIAQTAYAMTNEKDACFAAGCDGYIAKPIKRQLLIPVLAQIIPTNQQN